MPKDKIRLLPENLKTGVVCIDSYNDRRLCGRLWYGHFPKEKQFSSLMQFILMTDEAIGDLEFPDAYTRMRAFAAPEKTGSPAPALEQGVRETDSGELATFRVKIVFRQNASWQGVLTWVEGRKEESFRSVLELMMLMDGALTAAGKAAADRAI